MPSDSEKHTPAFRIEELEEMTPEEMRRIEAIFDMMDRHELPPPEFGIIVASHLSHKISQRELDESIARAGEQIGLSRQETAARLRDFFRRVTGRDSSSSN